ncbi:hypothetical protein MICPUN_112706 [Micromonas commoda]|uniref:Uncharacterized protein n=1 Tax=Micromonas commoda (strain RCC299 / NOUM17 / CCMP2709) TaxID=296587 RepID=C1EB41_MICCC|nr:hypothetical protein MICPUN_112706 [Micromonas commoda]ACO64964.1 hypothetical protein MICPUN_112706 [Micromonas commoda]|eukprot:XP_002503706.1 hypothetical protein MICPUN_112706 [Micromonas commoda]
MATPIISPENVGPPPYSSSLGFLPRPSFSARARTRAPRQSLRFKDRATGVDVTLVGTMHYNPVSIELASSTVTRLREADALHAVVLESCPSRWKKTQKTQPPGSFLRWFLYNEMLAAADAAGDPTKIRLGDQRIEDLGACARRTIADTTRDVLNPLGGWGRLVRDWRDGFDREINGRGDARGNLRAADLWRDAALLLGMPVSMFKYPMAWAIKSPKVIVPFAAFVWGIERIPTLVRPGGFDAVTGAYVMSGEERLVSALFLALDVAEVVFVSRLFLKALLETRNDILSRSIRVACEESVESGEGGGVVAVLGAAHLNGVQLRLMGDGDDEWWAGAGEGSGEGAGEDVAPAEAPSR